MSASCADPKDQGVTTMEPPDLKKLNKLFPGYEFVDQIEQGGMGRVYKAIQKSLNRTVAIKVMVVAEARRPAFVERFKREARAMALLSHPNIVAIHDYGEAEGLMYYVMDFVQGPNLRQYMNQRTLHPRRLLDIVGQICEALQFAHDHGIVHRDIKPSNILIDESGNVKVADFGLAKIMAPQSGVEMLTLPCETVGTPDYIAPEIVHGEQHIDHRADIYSLGVMIYEMLTGRLPRGAWQAPSSCGSHLRLDKVVERALQSDPDKRFQQARDISSIVHKLAHGMRPGADLPLPSKILEVEPLPKKPSPSLWIAAACIPIAFLTGGMALHHHGHRNRPQPASAQTTAPISTVVVKSVAQRQHDLAAWVFDHRGLVNIISSSQPERKMLPSDDVRSMEDLPSEDFQIWRVGFPGQTDFSDKEFAEFVPLAKETGTLEHLSLFGTGVTPHGLKPLPELQETLIALGLQQTEAVSDTSIPYITACRQLKHLLFTLQVPDSNNDLVAKLKEGLPECDISVD